MDFTSKTRQSFLGFLTNNSTKAEEFLKLSNSFLSILSFLKFLIHCSCGLNFFLRKIVARLFGLNIRFCFVLEKIRTGKFQEGFLKHLIERQSFHNTSFGIDDDIAGYFVYSFTTLRLITKKFNLFLASSDLALKICRDCKSL